VHASLCLTIVFGLAIGLAQPVGAIELSSNSNSFSTQQKTKPGQTTTSETNQDEEEEETIEKPTGEEPNKLPTRRTAKLLQKGLAGLATRLKVEPKEDGAVDGKKVGAKAACLAAKSLPRGKGLKC
jgi:hypothetical protein